MSTQTSQERECKEESTLAHKSWQSSTETKVFQRENISKYEIRIFSKAPMCRPALTESFLNVPVVMRSPKSS